LKIWERVGIGGGNRVEATEITARPPGAIALFYHVEGGPSVWMKWRTSVDTGGKALEGLTTS
jgi:hypothetical protein